MFLNYYSPRWKRQLVLHLRENDLAAIALQLATIDVQYEAFVFGITCIER